MCIITNWCFISYQPIIINVPLQFPLLISLLRIEGKPCVEMQGKSGYRFPLLVFLRETEGGNPRLCHHKGSVLVSVEVSGRDQMSKRFEVWRHQEIQHYFLAFPHLIEASQNLGASKPKNYALTTATNILVRDAKGCSEGVEGCRKDAEGCIGMQDIPRGSAGEPVEVFEKRLL